MQPQVSAEKKIEIQKLLSKMDQNGNGYVEELEFQTFMENSDIHLSEERSSYLFHLIQSLNAESRDHGSTKKGLKR